LITGILLFLAHGAVAQETYPRVEISGRVQQQFYSYDNDAYAESVGPRSNFFIRRARIEAGGKITERIAFYIQPSFEGGRSLAADATCDLVTIPAGGGTFEPNCGISGRSGVRLRDAWIELSARPESAATNVFLRVGQEKRPFSRYELTSSRNLPSIERGAGEGLPGRASNDLFEDAGYLSTDVGASVRVEHTLGGPRKAVLTAGIYNGQGESLDDVNDRKSYGARATVGVTGKLDLGGSWFRHDGIVGGDSSFTNTAFGLDAQWGEVGDPGPFLLAEFSSGEDASSARRSMRGFQAVAAFHLRMPGRAPWLYAIEPAIRFDVADPDTDADADQVRTVTGVLGLYLSSRAQLRIAYEAQRFQSPGLSSVGGVRSGLAVNF
jgi:hypothetical protein